MVHSQQQQAHFFLVHTGHWGHTQYGWLLQRAFEQLQTLNTYFSAKALG